MEDKDEAPSETDLKQGVQKASEAIAKDPENHVNYFRRGKHCYDLGDFENALEDFNKVLQLQPPQRLASVVYVDRGNTLHELGRDDEAIADYTKAIELNPNDGVAFYNRGLSYFSIDKNAEAIDDYSKAIEIDPNDAKVFYSFGLCRLTLKEYNLAYLCFKRALELDPEHVKSQRGLQEAQRNLHWNLNPSNMDIVFETMDKSLLTQKLSLYCHYKMEESGISKKIYLGTQSRLRHISSFEAQWNPKGSNQMIPLLFVDVSNMISRKVLN